MDEPTVCTRHLHWLPCLGQHQRYDGEDCLTTDNAEVEDIVRRCHGGLISSEQAWAEIGDVDFKPQLLDRLGVIV